MTVMGQMALAALAGAALSWLLVQVLPPGWCERATGFPGWFVILAAVIITFWVMFLTGPRP